jgi:hypothetical protein
MDGPHERKPFETADEADKAPPADDAELFKDELEFLETTSKLIDALKKYREPNRTANTYTMLGLTRDKYAYPPVIDDYIGKKDFSSIDVTISKEGAASSTTIEMYGSFGRIYISRDADGTENDSEKNTDQIIGDNGKPVDIDRVPDSQINDFLYSMTARRGIDPAVTRRSTEKDYIERVVGEDMRDALEDAAYSTSVHYTYELDEHTIVWFSQESSIYGEKLTTVTLRYRDYDMNDRTVDINIEKGLDIRFRTPESDNILSEYLFTRQEDYAIALRVIREETAKLISSAEEKRHFSLDQLPDSLLEEL